MQHNRFTDPDLIKQLKSLMKKDIDAFSRLIMRCLEEAPDEAILDSAPPEKKLKALGKLKDYFESIEDYENCATIKNIMDEINGQ